MQTRWGAQLLGDPSYNPNLSLNPPGFEIAFPPRWFDGALLSRDNLQS